MPPLARVSRVTPPPAYPLGAPNPYAGYGQAPREAQSASKAAAITALVLSLLACIPFLAAIAAAVLAGIVISRSKDGRDHGKGLAVAALVIAGLVLLAHTVLLAVGLRSGFSGNDAVRDSSGAITTAGDVSAFEVEVGDCFDDPALLSGAGEGDVESAEVAAVPCADPHEFEVYHVFDLSGDDYPGNDQVVAAAKQGCAKQFQTFVGRSYERSALEQYFYYPQESSWELQDERGVVCAVDDPDARTTGSLRDSSR